MFSRFFFSFLPLNLNLGNEDLIVVVPGDLGNSGLAGAQGRLRTDIYQKQIHIEPVHDSHTESQLILT